MRGKETEDRNGRKGASVKECEEGMGGKERAERNGRKGMAFCRNSSPARNIRNIIVYCRERFIL
jgi:hypothetical protein